MEDAAPQEPAQEPPGKFTSLSGRLLILTVVFVMLAEVLIWTPSIARFKKTYIEDQIARAYLSILALESLREVRPDASLESALLNQTETLAISLRAADRRLLYIGDDMPKTVDLTVDMMSMSWFGYIMSAFETLWGTDDRVIRAIGMPPNRPDIQVEVVFHESNLRKAMVDFSARILTLSIVISLFTATLVFVALQWLIVRPIRRLTRRMMRFRDNPEAPITTPAGAHRSDEIGVALRELMEMQHQIQSAMRQKDRLATLGASMAKINHDLRNTLATAVLVSDRLQYIEDPEVKKVTPRLMRAIDRAVAMCSQTLNYAAEETVRLRPETFSMLGLLEEVRSSVPVEDGREMTWRLDVDPMLGAKADRERMLCAVLNLCVNAVQAGANLLEIRVTLEDGWVHVEIADDGPGLPDAAKANLFKPFAGSARKGGTGLGLVIVRDTLRVHGGDVTLKRTGADGTVFELTFPQGDVEDVD